MSQGVEGLLGCMRTYGKVGIAGNGESQGMGLGVTGVNGRVPGGLGGDPWGLREMAGGTGGVGAELDGWWSHREQEGSRRPGGNWRGVPVGTGGPTGARRRGLVEILSDSQEWTGEPGGADGGSRALGSGSGGSQRVQGRFPMTQGDLGDSQSGLGGL